MNKLELGNCLVLIDKFESIDPELNLWKHGIDLGRLFKPELFLDNENGSVSSTIKIFEGDTSIASFSYDEVTVNGDTKYYCQLHLDDMVVNNINFELFEYLIKNKMNNYIMLKSIKNG